MKKEWPADVQLRHGKPTKKVKRSASKRQLGKPR